MTQNKDYNNTLEGAGSTATAVNFSADIKHGGSVGFQPGSTYKPFTLLNYLEATGGRYGLQTMCEGGGQANATIIERV